MSKKRFLKGILCSAAIVAGLMTAKPIIGYAEDLPEADPTKGVTIETEGSSKYINLNGNSVVIKESAASTTENPSVNLYIDANRNGIIDADEEMVLVDGIQDFDRNYSIFGVKNEKSTTPLSITVESGTINSVYAVFDGEIITEATDEAAVNINIKDGNIIYVGAVHNSNISASYDSAVKYIQDGGTVTGLVQMAYNSTLTAQGGESGVVDIDVSGGNNNGLIALSNSNVIGNEKSQALDMSVIGDAVISSIKIAYNYANDAENEDAVYKIVGNVSINLNYAEQSDSYNVSSFMGLNVSNDVTGDVSYIINNAKILNIISLLSEDSHLTGSLNIDISECEINYMSTPITDIQIDGDVKFNLKENTHINSMLQLLTNTIVNGNVNVEYDKLSYSNGFYALYQSSVSNKVAARINCAESGSSLYMVSGKHQEKEYSVGGDVSLAVIGGNCGYLYGVYNGVVNGNVNIDILNAKGYTFQGATDSQVKGDLIINAPALSLVEFSSTVNGISNSVIGGKFVFDFYSDADSYINIYGVSSSAVAKDIDINIGGKKFSSVYGLYNNNSSDMLIEGNVKVVIQDAEISSSIYGINSSKIAGNCDVKIYKTGADPASGNSYCYVYGIYSSEIGGTASLDISETGANNLYGLYIAKVNTAMDDVTEEAVSKITMNNNKVSNYLYNSYCSEINGNLTIETTKNICSQYYGFYGGKVNGNVTLNTSYENDSSIADDSGNSIVGNYANAGKYGFVGCTGGSISGSVDMNVESNHFNTLYLTESVDCNNGGNIIVTNGSYGAAGASIDVYPCYTNSVNESTDVKKFTVSFNGVDFSNCDSVNIINTLNTGYIAEVTIDDSCKLPDSYTILANRNSTGYGTVTYNGDYYIAGKGVISNDITAKNVYLGNSQNYSYAPGYLTIPEGVTITGSEHVYIPLCSVIVLEGKIVGDIMNTETDTTSNGRLCINGGSVDGSVTDVDSFYPVDLVYNEKCGKIEPVIGDKIGLVDDIYYGKSGSAVSVNISVNTGYKMISATWQSGSELPSDMAVSSGVYSFDMPDSPVTIKAEMVGKQIIIGKTVSDPVAKVGQVYTEEEPLYSLNDLTIANDAKEGTILYELAEGNSLPEGLIYKDGIIYGTATKAYEEGRKVVFKVTGKNETTANVTLNMIVTAGEAVQPEQDGRIFVDEESKEINLLGSSVVIDTFYNDTEEAVTGIYLDDNRDGMADRSVPVYSGDLSEFTIYGVKDADISKPVQITVRNGNVKNIYGAYGSNITAPNQDAVVLDYQGGNITNTTPVLESKTDGYVRLEYVTGTTVIVNGLLNSEYEGYYKNAAGAVNISGNYVSRKEVDAASLTVASSASSEVIFEKPVTVSGTYTMTSGAAVIFKDSVNVESNFSTYSNAKLTFEKAVIVNGNMSFATSNKATFKDKVHVTSKLSLSNSANVVLEAETTCDSLTLNYSSVLDIGETATLNAGTTTISSAAVYHRGIFAGTGAVSNNSGYWYMMGGTFAEGASAENVTRKYYPVTCETEFDKVAITPATGVSKVDGISYMSPDSAANTITYTVVAGYDSYISVNGSQSELMESSPYTFTMASEPVNIVVDYVPKSIRLAKKYADPVIVAGTEYTEGNPVYNLKTLSILYDTTSEYGGNVLYALKNGSSLPEGLRFVDGRIVGTPVTANGDGETVKFVVTGRNGTTANVELNIVIKDEGYAEKDINEVVTVSGYNINLNGASVVIIPDADDTSKSGIYMDADHDGIADNNHALIINGQSSYALKSYRVYGYNNTEEAYEGDISIYVLGGSVGAIYGVYGKSNAYATVNGSVNLYLKAGSYTTASTSYYGNVTTAGFYVTGGSFSSDVYAIRESEVDDYNFEFTGKATMSGSLYASYCSNIAKNVDAKVGVDSSSYGFTGTSNHFYGVYGGTNSYKCKTVGGDVNYIIDGYWYTKSRGMNFLAYNTEIAGNLNIDWKDGSFGSKYADNSIQTNGGFARETTVNNINVNIAETADISTGILNVIVGGTVNHINCVVPKSDNIRINTLNAAHSNFGSNINGSAYVNNEGEVQIYGTYTITEDIDATKLVIAEGADVTIAEGVNVSVSDTTQISGTLNNYGNLNVNYTATVAGTINNCGNCNLDYKTTVTGVIDNSGILTAGLLNTKTLVLQTGAALINRETGTFEMGAINNSGCIVNYGTLNQSYKQTNVGKIYTTTVPNMKYALSSYTAIYYHTYIDDDYPAYCVNSVTLKTTDTANMATGVIEGDTNTYIKGNAAFYVELGTLLDGIAVEKVTFGSDNQTATTTNQTQYQGTLGYEPTVIKLSFTNTNTDIEGIALDKTTDEVTTLQVGKATTASSPAYDLTKLVISNDDDSIANAYVTYQLGVDSNLPAGMTLRNGKIYGTPTTATDEANTVNIIVKGKNQTYAAFALTFTSVAKGVPSFALPGVLKANAGDTLANVILPISSSGVYSWPDSSLSAGDVNDEGNEFDILFTPADTVNYDWSLIDSSVGTFANGVVTTKVTIKIRKLIPAYVVPDDITAVYGDSLADVIIPETEEGSFVWNDNTQSVGDVGKHVFIATYIPKDTANYDNVENIKISVTVKPQSVSYTPELETVYGKEGQTLSEIQLPDVDGGKYQWVTQVTTIVEDGVSYKVGYLPEDVTNYDWTAVSGWSNAYKAVIFNVTIVAEHEHLFGEDWQSDAANHWHVCTCGEKSDVEEHTWDAGTVTKKPTATAEGVKTFTCTVCKQTKTEKVPATGSTAIDITKSNAKITVSGISNKNYTGKAQKQSKLIVKSGSKTLTSGKDYTLTYSNNVKVGTATITITGKGSYKGTIKKTFKITLSKGKTYVVKNIKYKVTKVGTSGKGTVSVIGTTYKKTNKKFKKLTIASTVNIGGVKYKVTEIGNNAFKGYKNLTTVTIGSNVKKIGKNAFYGCKKLKTITIKSTKLTKKSVGSKAFKGTYKKPTVKVPKKKLKTYKAILKSKGISKSARYKKG